MSQAAFHLQQGSYIQASGSNTCWVLILGAVCDCLKEHLYLRRYWIVWQAILSYYCNWWREINLFTRRYSSLDQQPLEKQNTSCPDSSDYIHSLTTFLDLSILTHSETLSTQGGRNGIQAFGQDFQISSSPDKAYQLKWSLHVPKCQRLMLSGQCLGHKWSDPVDFVQCNRCLWSLGKYKLRPYKCMRLLFWSNLGWKLKHFLRKINHLKE